MPATTYTIRKKVLTLLGAQFHVYNASDELIGYCKQKAFKLKEDIRVFSDETMSTERLSIKARSIIDFSSAYDVFDSQKNVKVGALQRKGLTSILRDSWIAMDADNQEIGKIQEDSMLIALLRRFMGNLASILMPQSFHLRDDEGNELASFHANRNPFVQKMTVVVQPEGDVSPFLVLAAGILLVAIEGRQQ